MRFCTVHKYSSIPKIKETNKFTWVDLKYHQWYTYLYDKEKCTVEKLVHLFHKF